MTGSPWPRYVLVAATIATACIPLGCEHPAADTWRVKLVGTVDRPTALPADEIGPPWGLRELELEENESRATAQAGCEYCGRLGTWGCYGVYCCSRQQREADRRKDERRKNGLSRHVDLRVGRIDLETRRRLRSELRARENGD